MRIWNLTPHVMHYHDGETRLSFESDGQLRLLEEAEPADDLGPLKTVMKRYGDVVGLPDGIQPGDVLMVSTLVGDHWPQASRPDGITLLVPDTGDTCQRDASGRIVAVSQFIRK